LSSHCLYRFGNFELDPVARVLAPDGAAVSLTRKDLDVLIYLVSNAPRVVTNQESLEVVWPDTFVDKSNLIEHISALRGYWATSKASCARAENQQRDGSRLHYQHFSAFSEKCHLAENFDHSKITYI
jgi:DNA-binding winged helix-turn-helix (wHTH) protein